MTSWERRRELAAEDLNGVLRNADKFGGFPTGLWLTYPLCPLQGCGQHLQVLFCLTHLCWNMERKGYSYHVSTCPLHKHLFATTFR